MICNHDCFNCPYPDCKSTDQQDGIFEKAITGALYRWDTEIRVKRIAYMKSCGYTRSEIMGYLKISESEYVSANHYNRKKAAPLLAQQNGTSQNILTT